MIVPTRFGLKYAPIPTLALEYEDDLKGVVDATGQNSSSLYVYRDGDSASPPPVPTRKLHVVELPMLTRTSETQQITRQLQQDNGRFLAPGLVSETQLKRLLDRLVENLPPAEVREPAPVPMSITREVESERREDAASESELEESLMEESVMEESAVEKSATEASRSDEHEPPVVSTPLEGNPNRGALVSHDEESDRGDGSGGEEDGEEGAPPPIDKPGTTHHGYPAGSHDELDGSEHESDDGGDTTAPAAASEAEKEDEQSDAASEREEDAKKTRALRSESDVSEEDVQSEELEYFSEDGSDEDSF